MKNTKTKVGSFAIAKLQAKRRSLLAITIAVITGFTFTACNKGGSASGGSKDGGSASSSNVKTSPESDFEAEPIDGGK